MAKVTKRCGQCGWVGQVKGFGLGRFIFELSWYLWFIVPGLLATNARKKREKKCPNCGLMTLLPFSTQSQVILNQANSGVLSAQASSPPPPPSQGSWEPDPWGRFEFRWHDGNDWTERVSTQGRSFSDPPG